MMTYKFATPDNTIAQRDDGAFVLWSPVASDGPLDKGGGVYRRWKDEGSPIPDPYVAPAPTADEVRTAQFNSDTDRQNIITTLATATPAQIKTFCSNNFPSLTAAERLLMAKIILLLVLTIRS
jgi:hypothetical protein